MTGFDNYSGKNARLHVRAQQFRRTSRTRRDTNERERSKSKDQENYCPHSYEVTENT